MYNNVPFLENFFDHETMSIHLKEDCYPLAKKGSPDSWNLVKLDEYKLSYDDLRDLSDNLVQLCYNSSNAFIEKKGNGSLILQYKAFRIVITEPPLSNKFEITAVKQIKKLGLEDYSLSQKLLNRLNASVEGVLVSGSPGQGKTTFVSALGNFLAQKSCIVKTIESPRDLILPDSVTQYSLNIDNIIELRNIMLLSRPDYVIFDEMRNPEDFKLFSDLRLCGIGLIGVAHGTNPLDSVQRFIGRVELGIIPHIIDTIIFISKGHINKVLKLVLVVKTPYGISDKALARPLIEIRDFDTDKLEYELYKYGEETFIVPIKYDKSNLKDYLNNVIDCPFSLEFEDSSVRVLIPEENIKSLNFLDIFNTIKRDFELDPILVPVKTKKNYKLIDYEIKEEGKYLKFITKVPETSLSLYIDNNYVLLNSTSKTGILKINNNTLVYKKIKSALNFDKSIELRHY